MDIQKCVKAISKETFLKLLQKHKTLSVDIKGAIVRHTLEDLNVHIHMIAIATTHSDTLDTLESEFFEIIVNKHEDSHVFDACYSDRRNWPYVLKAQKNIVLSRPTRQSPRIQKKLIK